MSNYEEPSTSEESTTTVFTVQIPKHHTVMMELLQSLMSQVDRMEASLTPTMQLLGVVIRYQEIDNNCHLPPYPKYQSHVIVVDRWDTLQ